MKRIALVLFVLLGQLNLWGQGYEINVNIKGFKGDTCILAYHLADKNYIKDTVQVKDGKMVFKGKEELPGGMYMVLLPPENRYFQVLISKGEQKFSMETSEPNFVEGMQIKGSKDNQLFYEYMKFLGGMNTKATPLRTLLETYKATPDAAEYKKAKDDMAKLDEEVKSFQSSTIKNNPKSLTAAIIRANLPFELPKDIEAIADTTERQRQGYYYYRRTFFEDFDITDERMIRTPFVEQKLNYWIEKLTVSHPDSMIASVDYVLNKVRGNKEAFQYYSSTLLNYFAKSKIICMDAVYVHIADNYYCNPGAPFGGGFWLDKETKEKICANANELRPVLCNKPAPNITVYSLDSLNQKPTQLYSVKAKYTVVYFWDPDCGNCKKMSDKMVQIYPELKKRGAEVFGICSKDYREYNKCAQKVKEVGMQWPNNGDPYFQGKAKQSFDIKMTPFIYLLDENKKIIFKRIDPDQLIDVLDNDIKRKAAKG